MRSYTHFFLMKHTTPILPAFGPLLFGRRPKSEQAKALEKLKSANTLGDLKSVCTDSIPDELLSPAAKGDLSRRRQYSLPVLFWAFLALILTPNTSCREIVRRVQAWRAGADSETNSSHKTVAYSPNPLPKFLLRVPLLPAPRRHHLTSPALPCINGRAGRQLVEACLPHGTGAFLNFILKTHSPHPPCPQPQE